MSPALVLSFVIIICCGSLFHAVLGRQLWQWPLFLGTSLIGFFGGFLAAVTWNFEWLRVGDVPLLLSLAGAILAASLAWFFSSPRAISKPASSNR